MPDSTISDKQLAANRANAARSTGPRTPEGKARSSQNARRHSFGDSNFTVVRLEDHEQLAHLRADLIALYQPVNSQELFALERIAVAQQALLRASRLESGLLTKSFDVTLNDRGQSYHPLNKALIRDIEVSRSQHDNFTMAQGFDSMISDSKSWTVFLRYQAQTERHYRRALEEFERLKALRVNLPNEPILDIQPQETETTCDPGNEPISNPEPIRVIPS